MRGAYESYLRMNGSGRYDDAVAAVTQERRLALIQNGAHPDFQNGVPFPDQARKKKGKGKRKGY